MVKNGPKWSKMVLKWSSVHGQADEPVCLRGACLFDCKVKSGGSLSVFSLPLSLSLTPLLLSSLSLSSLSLISLSLPLPPSSLPPSLSFFLSVCLSLSSLSLLSHSFLQSLSLSLCLPSPLPPSLPLSLARSLARSLPLIISSSLPSFLFSLLSLTHARIAGRDPDHVRLGISHLVRLRPHPPLRGP